MNKIVLDQEEVIAVDGDLDIVVSCGDRKEITLYSLDTKASIHYKIEKDASLVVHHYTIDCSFAIEVLLSGENASVDYFYSTLNEKDHSLSFDIVHEASNTSSRIVNHGVATCDGTLLFDINPSVLKNSELCCCNQENSIINLGEGEVTIRPNLLIDHYNVSSSHSAYIGTFSEELLFYLMSRGLSRKVSFALLLQYFLVKDVAKLTKIFPQFLEKLKDL